MSLPRIFRHDHQGAPQLTKQPGDLLAVLDACLVNGYNLQTLDSLSVSGGTATATVAAGHGFVVDQIVRIEGATPAELNGDFRITSATATTFDFATTAADGAATGTITAKAAPAGWERPYVSGDGLTAVYRPLVGNRYYYQVDASNAAHGLLAGYRSMTDAVTGTDPFQAAATYIPLDDSGNADNPSQWILAADAYTAYLWVRAYGAGYGYYLNAAMGDLRRLTAGDAWSSMAAGWHQNYSSNSSAIVMITRFGVASEEPIHLPSDENGASSSLAAYLTATGDDYSGVIGDMGPAYPAPPHNGLVYMPLWVHHGGYIRAQLRGLYMPMHSSGLIQDGLYTGENGARFMVMRGVSAGTWNGRWLIALDDWGAA